MPACAGMTVKGEPNSEEDMATNASPRPVPKAETDGRGTVADSMAATLRDYGTRFAFGFPGNDVLELIRACDDEGIPLVLAKRATAAAYMDRDRQRGG